MRGRFTNDYPMDVNKWAQNGTQKKRSRCAGKDMASGQDVSFRGGGGERLLFSRFLFADIRDLLCSESSVFNVYEVLYNNL